LFVDLNDVRADDDGVPDRSMQVMADPSRTRRASSGIGSDCLIWRTTTPRAQPRKRIAAPAEAWGMRSHVRWPVASVRRTLPAMAVALTGFVAISLGLRLAVPMLVRPQTLTFPFGAYSPRRGLGDWPR
jgi:hypothetical protein